jgi:outer membrane receptor protein involved in Fe transport
MMRAMFSLLVCVTLALLQHSEAQGVSSTIQGTVKDPSGAVITGARVTATSLETGISRSSLTGADGTYHIDGLSEGAYELKVEHPGFKAKKLTNIVLLVNQEAVLDANLDIGSPSEVFTITGETPLVETTTAQMSNVVTATTLSQLPLNGRDLFQLTELQTGVMPSTNGGSSLWSEGNMTKASAQGTRPTMNNVTLDGGDINDPGYNVPPGGPAGAQLGVEAVREFRVVLNSYSAEYGRNGGANVQFVTKSGTNTLHGSVFEFLRNADLDAANFFDTLGKPAFERNQFGATLGGPIVKGHTFFFANYEGLRESKGITSNISVPDDNARLGLLPSANGSSIVNVGVNPISALFVPLYPKANGSELTNADGVPSGLALFTGSEVQRVREDYAVLRIDQAIGNKDQMFGRYVFDDGVGIFPFQSTAIPGFPGKRPIRNQYLMLSWQRTITNLLLNEAKFNFNRTRYLAETDNSYPLSISLVPDRALGVILIGGLPALGNNLVYPLGTASNTFEGIDNVSWEHQRHSLKFGADVKRMQINGPFDFGTNGEYSFTGSSSSTTSNPTLEAFLQGIPAFYIGTDPTLSDSDRGFRQNYIGIYAQDDWRITSNLTLNLGLRWEYSSIPTEAHGRISNFHDVFTDTAPIVGPLWSSVPLDLWSPRFGFAWSPFGDAKTVVRGGFGIMRDQIWSNLYFDIRFYRPFFGALISESPNFLAPPTSIAALGGSTSPVGVFGITYNPQFPYYEQWSLNVQHSLGRETVFQIAYVGSDGLHLPRAGEANPFEPVLGHNLNPNFGSTPLIVTDATSQYNSMQASVQRRFTAGFSFQGSYTYSHSIDTASGPFPSDWVSEPGVSQNFFNLKADRGSSAFDRRNAFIGNLLYDLPFGPGQRWGRGERGTVGKLVGGWRSGLIAQLLSGVPFTPVLGFNNSLTAGSFPADRPDIKAGVNPCTTVTGNFNQWFEPTIFTLPNTPDANGNIFGDAGRNSLCGPSLKEFDFSLIKHTAVTEGVNLEFRAEFFNIFNHPNFNVPDNTQGPNGTGGNGDAIFVGRATGCNPGTDSLGCGILAGNAGRIFSTVTSSRQIQFSLKLIF